MPEQLDLLAQLDQAGDVIRPYPLDLTRTVCGFCLPGAPSRHSGCRRDRYATASDEHGRAWLCSCPCWNPPPPKGD